jgi:hypothetical protein
MMMDIVEKWRAFCRWQQQPPLPLYLFFRKSPNIPDMRFSEMVVTMVYITSLIEITAIILDFQPFSIIQDFNEVTLILPVVAMKQLSGFPWWKTILFAILSYAIALILAFLFISAFIILLSHFWSFGGLVVWSFGSLFLQGLQDLRTFSLLTIWLSFNGRHAK